MEREVKLNLILRHLHTDFNTDKGTEKIIKENPYFIPALSCVPRDEFLKLEGCRTFVSQAPSLRGKTCPKWHPATLWAGNVQEAIRVVILNTRAQKPPCSFFHRSHLSTPPLCRMAPSSPPMAQHEALRHGLTRPIPQSMARVLLHHVSKFASARTRESCSLLHRVMRKPAVMPFSSI